MAYLRYEEGTWTPALQFGGASTGITYDSRTGYYRRIGDVVFYIGFIDLSSKGSATGNATISGLPFPNDSLSFSGARNIVGGITGFTFTANYGSLFMELLASSSTLDVVQVTNTSLGVSLATNTNFSDATTLFFNGQYFI